MIRHLIIRNELYPEEYRPTSGIPEQISIFVDCRYPNVDLYEANVGKHLIEEGSLIKKNVHPRSGLIRLIIYVQDKDLALKLAERWVNEPSQRKDDYQVIGIEHDYSVFD
jgi:hypothetical protein